MLKKINRVLKLVGLNLVRAKRKKAVKSVGIPYDASKHMGECEWQNTPPVPNPGKTHYVGDDCPGGHAGEFIVGPVGVAGPLGPDDSSLGRRKDFACCREGTQNVAFGYVTEARVVNPDAAFVPVDIGVDDHEITRTEHGVCPVTHFHGCCCVKCIEEVDKPRVQQPNSDNKVNGPSS